MHLGKTKPLLTTLIALAAALAAQQSMAVIVLPGSPSSQERAGDILLQSSFNQLLVAGASVPRPSCPGSEEGEDQAPRVQPKTFLGGGWSCDAASISATSSSSTTAAIPNAASHVAESGLQSRLPREPAIILTTGPPFEILRPA